jgi:hypothetical protein
MYHSQKTPLIDNKFNMSYISNDDRFLHGSGIYFTPDRGYAHDNFSGDNGVTYECYLSLKKQFKVNLDEDDEVIFDELFQSNFKYQINKEDIISDILYYEEYIINNFDHVYMTRIDEDGDRIGPDELIVFDTKNIKSIKNKGEWDMNSDDIYH